MLAVPGASSGRPVRRGPWNVPALVLLLALVVALPAAARAQDTRETGEQEHIDTPYRWIRHGFRVGLLGGYMSADRGVSQLGPGSTEILGARVRGRLSSPLSLEGGVTYGSSNRYVVDPRLPQGPAPVDTVASEWILAEAALQVAVTGARTWHGIQPYVVVGGGFLLGIVEEESPVFVTEEGEELDRFQFRIRTAPQVQAGVGAEYLLGERWGLSVELRDHLWRLTTPDGFFDQEILDTIERLELTAPVEKDWTHNLGLTVSVWRYF